MIVDPQFAGLLGAAATMVVVMLICRWVFSTTIRDDRTARRLEKARSLGDYGLLVPVATARTREDAEMLRAVLQSGGIRATLSESTDGLQILVFRADAVRARTLVSS